MFSLAGEGKDEIRLAARTSSAGAPFSFRFFFLTVPSARTVSIEPTYRAGAKGILLLRDDLESGTRWILSAFFLVSGVTVVIVVVFSLEIPLVSGGSPTLIAGAFLVYLTG